jgi:CubicO group peptidase (beta-lactamase class C family)
MSESSTPIDGVCDARFAAVRDAFRENFESRGEPGAALAVSLNGRVVVDLWGGWADRARSTPWRRDTLVNVFSVSKAFCTICALRLVERGLIDLDAPLAECWPEFGIAGKETITLRRVLSHRAGMAALRRALPDGAALDWQAITNALAEQAPWWVPGSGHGYHVNTFGFLVGEVVRRVSGRTLGTFLREEIAHPLGADVHIGLSSGEERRIAEYVWPTEMAPDAVHRLDPTDDRQLMIRNTYVNPPGLSGYGTVNTSRWRRAEIPSTNGHATARGVARIYAALAAGGKLDGIEVVGSATLREAVTEHANGPDAVLGRSSRFGLGFQLPQPERPLGPNPGAFGHFGAGGALGFADPEAGVAFGYVMNRMGPRWQNPTTRNLMEALYSCL